MRQALVEFIELLARAVGIRASYEMPAPTGQILFVLVAIVVGACAAAWWAGRLTSSNPIEGDASMILRGGFLIVFYGGLALIFVAGVAWAWRSLFG